MSCNYKYGQVWLVVLPYLIALQKMHVVFKGALQNTNLMSRFTFTYLLTIVRGQRQPESGYTYPYRTHLCVPGGDGRYAFLWPPIVIGRPLYFCPVVSSIFFFCLPLLSFFPRLILAVADCMSTILPHMMWPWCRFRMQVRNVLRAARWKCRTQKSPNIRHLGTIARLCHCRAISSQLRHISTIGTRRPASADRTARAANFRRDLEST